MAANIEYLTFAQRAIDTTPDPALLKAALLAAYPDRTGAAIVYIYLPFGTED